MKKFISNFDGANAKKHGRRNFGSLLNRRSVPFFILMIALHWNIIPSEAMGKKLHLDIKFKTDKFSISSGPTFCERGQWKLIYIDGRAVKALSFQGEEKTLFETDRFLNVQNLVCSLDGSIIATTDQNWSLLYIFVTDALSVYQLDNLTPSRLADESAGHFSIMSPEGNTFSLVGQPHLIFGPDVLVMKKVVIASIPPRWWINEQPYTTSTTSNRLYKINVSSGELSLILITPERTWLAGIVDCAGKEFIGLKDIEGENSIYPFPEEIPDYKNKLRYSSAFDNDKECILEAVKKDNSIVLYNGSTELNYVANDSEQYQLLESSFRLSRSGCWILGVIWEKSSKKRVFGILENPFQAERSCS